MRVSLIYTVHAAVAVLGVLEMNRWETRGVRNWRVDDSLRNGRRSDWEWNMRARTDWRSEAASS